MGDVYDGIGSDGAEEACAVGTVFVVERKRIIPIVTENTATRVAVMERFVTNDFLIGFLKENFMKKCGGES